MNPENAKKARKKFNLIDFLVILLILAIVFVAAWKLGLGNAAKTSAAQTHHIIYKIEFENLNLDILDFAQEQVGKQLMNDGKILDATIVDAYELAEDSHEGTIDITVEADAIFAQNVYSVGPQEIRVGYEYILKTSELELTGTICYMEIDAEPLEIDYE